MAEIIGELIAITVMAIVGVVIIAQDSLIPLEDPIICSGNMRRFDFLLRSARVVGMRLFADIFLVYLGRKHQIPYHLTRMRFTITTVVGISFFACTHATLLIIAFREVASEINNSVKPCLPLAVPRW
ncbi:hypothetical protein BC829DRAFT_406894 [Chytridium lagenaria]|nr:hypothetical protein BC829DRAFT_406894 [Chytridium lagenaria]